MPSLLEAWSNSLPPDATRAISALLDHAARAGLSLYLVGGPLRDLLLGRPSLDIDIAVEGPGGRRFAHPGGQVSNLTAAPAIALARAATPQIDARLVTHPAFGTATFRPAHPEASKGEPSKGGYTLDLITARSEAYARPGALPTVRPGTIEDDLARRDFTINAMALALNGPERGRILDPHGGRADLRAGLIRVLHERSFQDDATRILRAARYAARFSFRMEPNTARLLERDARYLSAISAARLHHEFSRIAAEPEPEQVLARLSSPLSDVADGFSLPQGQPGPARPEEREHQLPRPARPEVKERHLPLPARPEVSKDERSTSAPTPLEAIHPTLHFTPAQAEAMRDARARGAPLSTFWPLLAYPQTPEDAASLASRLALTKPQRAAVEGVPHLLRGLSRVSRLNVRNSHLVDFLDPFPLPALWAVALTSKPPERDPLLKYLTTLRHIRPRLTGDDLLALGVPQGPQLGEALRRLHATRLDGELKTRKDEEQFVRKLLGGSS